MLGRTPRIERRGRSGRPTASATIRFVWLAAVFGTAGTLSACGEDFVTQSARFDCSICADIGVRTENCGLLDVGTTADDYEATCIDGVSRLCGDDAAHFLGFAEECLKRSICSDFSSCYFLTVDSFRDRADCVGSCEGV